MEIRPVRAELFHAGRHDEANSRFSQFSTAPKNLWSLIIFIIFTVK
jgi:hypothetical protein